jgi:long-chain fatty acid transport protein
VRRGPRRANAVWCALLALASAEPALASPGIDFGFGSRVQALGGAGVALADDAPAVFHNPSGLARAEHVSVTAGYSSVAYSQTVSGVPADLPTVRTFDAGLVVPGRIGKVPVAFGFALALPDGRLSRLREPQTTEAYWALDDAGPRLVDVGSTFALRLLPELAIGGGIGFQASLRGTFQVEGTAVVADGQGREYESSLRHAVHADLTASRFPLVGLTYLPAEWLAVGLSYRGASLVEHQIDGVLDGRLVIGKETVPVRYAFQTHANVAYTPAQVALGASGRPLPHLQVTAELDWQRYSAYRSPYAQTSTHVDIPPELELDVPDQLAVPAPPAHFSDRFVPRLGVEPDFELAPRVSLALRAGYSYQHAPVPHVQPETRLLALDRHVLSLGAGGSWKKPVAPFAELALDLTFAAALGVSQTFTTTVGPNADRASGHALLFGATLRVAFQGE